jgi:hypothetical protein
VALAGRPGPDPESVERTIVLCREKNALLDVLYVSVEDREEGSQRVAVLPRRMAENARIFRLLEDTLIHRR